MQLLLERRGTEVSLLPAIKQGGEGSIHPIAGEPSLVAKVFSQPSRERAEKLCAMLDNPPVVAGNAPVTLAWPLDRLLTRAGECVGYVMPYLKDKELLFTMYHPGSRPRSADYPFMLRTARNIAVAVSAFHRHGYVVGDINESNILVGPDASVAVVDTDSIQVRTKRNLFRCQVGKPEFTPPELLLAGRSYDQVDRHPHHDSFGLAVVIFLLLMDGNHPFAARCVGAVGRPALAQRIAQGQWPYSGGRKGAYRPRWEAPPLESLSPDIQHLMRECFDAGHHNPKCRPTADAWHQALTKAEVEWNEIGTRLRYYYHRVLRPRVWGQNLLSIPDRLRVGVARVPRKDWITVASVVVIALLIFWSLRWSRSTEAPRAGAIGEQQTQQCEPERETEGKETASLGREVQRLPAKDKVSGNKLPEPTPQSAKETTFRLTETEREWVKMAERLDKCQGEFTVADRSYSDSSLGDEASRLLASAKKLLADQKELETSLDSFKGGLKTVSSRYREDAALFKEIAAKLQSEDLREAYLQLEKAYERKAAAAAERVEKIAMPSGVRAKKEGIEEGNLFLERLVEALGIGPISEEEREVFVGRLKKHGEHCKALAGELRNGIEKFLSESETPEIRQKLGDAVKVKVKEASPQDAAGAKKFLGLLCEASWSSPVTIGGVQCVTVVRFSKAGTCSQSTYILGRKGKGPLVAIASGTFDVDADGFLTFYQAETPFELGKVSFLGKDQWSYEILYRLLAPDIAGTRLTFSREP